VTGAAGRSLGEHSGEDAGARVKIVMDFGCGLALMRAQDTTHVLQAVEGPRTSYAQGPTLARLTQPGLRAFCCPCRGPKRAARRLLT